MKTEVIIPGAVKSGRNAKGFNLNKFVKKLLESMGFAVTTDCCTYYPTVPLLEVENANLPSEAEMIYVPIFGMFRTGDNLEGTIWIKLATDNADALLSWS